MYIPYELDEYQKFSHIPANEIASRTTKSAQENNDFILKTILALNKRMSPTIADVIEGTQLSSAKCYRGIDKLLVTGYVKSHVIGRAKHLDVTTKGKDYLTSSC